MSLTFLETVAHAGNAVSPIAATAGARTSLHDGWRVAAGCGDPAAEERAVTDTVGVADVSHVRKFELRGHIAHPLGAGVRRASGWLLPLTRTRALLVGSVGDHGGSAVESHDVAGLDVLDVTACYAALAVAGPLAREAFARFCALDLRSHVLPVGGLRPGSVARTPGLVLRDRPDRFVLLVGAALGQYVWEVVIDAAVHLGGAPVDVTALGSPRTVAHA